MGGTGGLGFGGWFQVVRHHWLLLWLLLSLCKSPEQSRGCDGAEGVLFQLPLMDWGRISGMFVDAACWRSE